MCYSSNRKLVNCFHLSKKSWKLIHISGNHCSFNLKAVIPTIILSSKNMFSCHEFSWRCFVSIQCLIPLSTVNKSCWVLEDVLTAHLLLTAGKKWALTKAYKFTLKAEKVFWTLKGAHIDSYTNKEERKKKKIAKNKQLSLINLYLSEQRRPACIAKAHHLTGGCVNLSHSQKKTS